MSPTNPLADLEALQAHMASVGFHLAKSTRGLLVLHPDEPTALPVEIVWATDAQVVHFRVGLPLQISADQWEHTASTVCRVNAQLGIGAFSLRHGLIFEVATYLDEFGAISSFVAEKYVRLCQATVAKYRSELAKALSQQ